MEARENLRCRRKRARPAVLDVVHVEPPKLEVDLPTVISKHLCNHENARVSFAVNTGPRGAIDSVAATWATPEARKIWCDRARIAAILGSCADSLPSVRSGCRCYYAFAEKVLRKPSARCLPPSVDDLLAWSCTFRCAETFGNYLSYVKVGTLLAGKNAEVFRDNVLARAKKSIKKRACFSRRERLFLQLDVVRQLLNACGGHGVDLTWGMLYLFSYTFLLRLPSEALPVVRADTGFAHNSGHACMVFMEGEHLCLKLKKRKNKPQGSLLKRACWCCQCRLTCPVHALWPHFEKLKVGERAFPGIYSGKALRQLRVMLELIGIENASKFRCHDLRRGHAKDLQLRGANLYEILAAGEWRSPAFLEYLSLGDLEMGAVIEAHQAESSSEDEDYAC